MPISPSPLRKNILCLWICVVLGVMILSVISGTFGQIGIDSDDMMRLVQIRDLYQGQSWFDVSQTRMGPGGTDMHWSRIVDLPIVLLIGLFDIFMPYAQAERLVITLWPPLTSIFVIWGVLVGARHMRRSDASAVKTQYMAMIMLALWLVMNVKFAPGAIDHHNLQLGLLALTLGYTADPDMRAKSYGIAALALALSMAIGAEINVFAAFICGFFAVNWALNGHKAKRGTLAFGGAFAATLVVVFVSTIAPQSYGNISCDAFSVIHILAGGAGAAGLAICAQYLSAKSLKARICGLCAVGAVCAAIILIFGPQCLNNPLNELPTAVKSLWLDNVIEAQPLFGDREKWLSVPPYALGAPLVALIIAALGVIRKNRVTVNGLFALLLISAIALCLYQIRFNIFGILISMFILPAWIAHIHTESRAKSEGSLAYLPALIISIPMFWGIPGQLFGPKSVNMITETQNSACYSPPVIEAVRALDTGMFSIPPNGGSQLLMKTPHSVLSGNYHRNIRGIRAQILAMTSSPDSAQTILKDAKVDYVFFCKNSPEALSAFAKDGLEAALSTDDIPDYLTPVAKDIAQTGVTIFRLSE